MEIVVVYLYFKDAGLLVRIRVCTAGLGATSTSAVVPAGDVHF